MKRLIAPVACVLLLGCNLNPTTIPEGVDCGPEPTMAQAESAIHVWVQNSGLKDPSSAQIQNVQIVGRAGMYRGLVNNGGYDYGWTITFQCNAKNSYGGYVGFRNRSILLSPGGRVHWQIVVE